MKSLMSKIHLEEINKWISTDLDTSIIIITSVLLIFLVLIIYVRIAGLRTFAKMTSFDFATTIAIGSILASVSISPTYSIGDGGVALASIICFQIIFAFLQRTSNFFKKAATNAPLLLMKDGVILEKNLAKSNLVHSELMAKLREANVLRFQDVKAVVFESTGDVSVLHKTGDGDINLEDRILDFRS